MIFYAQHDFMSIIASTSETIEKISNKFSRQKIVVKVEQNFLLDTRRFSFDSSFPLSSGRWVRRSEKSHEKFKTKISQRISSRIEITEHIFSDDFISMLAVEFFSTRISMWTEDWGENAMRRRMKNFLRKISKSFQMVFSFFDCCCWCSMRFMFTDIVEIMAILIKN